MPLDPIRVVDNYGSPTYGAMGPDVGRPLAMVVGHTPENANIFLTSAIAVTDWQATPGNTSGGSYHGVWACEDGKDPADYRNIVLVRSVPWNMACGGMHPPSVNPLQWVRDLAPAWALADPNAHSHQMALSGKSSWYRSTPPAVWNGFVVRYAQMVRILETAYRYDAVLVEHTHMQPPPNRFDVTGTFVDLVLAEYIRQGEEPPPPVGRFDDLDPTSVHNPDIEWAAANGFMNGTGPRTFNPKGAVTREQLATVMHRYDVRSP